ncbi:hypothetical protein SK128_016447 [Halocaridina rubra]|uniref:Condensation domain-containing protein n=1 Tax=Halocaridina rubra TaxID=373956 RepID=A0AAN8WS61_HALRR
MTGFEGKWLWPATPIEEFSEVGHLRGTFLISYQLTIASAAPLQEGHVQRTLQHLYHKVPSLRTCYGTRDGIVWLREATNKNIDFQVVKPNYCEWDVMNALRSYRYNSETGPLWCARLLPVNQKVIPGCPIESDFPHRYHIFLGLHHGIADGMTAMKICGFIVTLLEDVIAGKHISDEEQLGDYVGQEETCSLINEKKVFLEQNPTKKNEAIKEIESYKDAKSVFMETLALATGTKNRTRSVTHFLNPEITHRFIQKCRAEGVTVHSAFTSLANVAIADILNEKGIDQESYKIINNHVINIRRYWTGDTSRSLGCHIVAPMRLYTDVPRNICGYFWDFARRVHDDLQNALNGGVILRNQAIGQLTSTRRMDPDDFFYPLLPADYCTSNLGDVTSLVTEGGEHIRPLRVLRSVSIHSTNASWSHLFNTFRGRFVHVLDYNNGTVPKELAQSYSDQIFRRLEEVI